MNTPNLVHKLSPKLAITPQLKQALHILRLPVSALKEYLEQQISENSLLNKTPSDKNLETTINAALNTARSLDPGYFARDDLNKNADLSAERAQPKPGLQEHLLHQARMSFPKSEDLSIAERLIEQIDHNGYLRASLITLAENMATTIARVEHVLSIIQTFDPNGVGARNLQECLLIQLKNNEQEQSPSYLIVRSYFKELAGKKFSTISKALQMDNRDVKKAVNTITRLNPKPGAVFDDQSHAATLVPDVLISMRGNKISLLLNEKDLPRLRINLRHRKLLENPDTPQKTKQFIIQQLKKALWLIKSVRQRRINTLKVLNALAGAQKAAIFGDLSQLKPLTLKDIALKTQLHVSTVSRIIADKYAETPQGIMKLKDLFSAKLASSKQGKEAAKGARFKISKIILSENKTRPLTDTDISRILKKRGTSISRRTVAKYRNQLKIPPAFLR